MRGATTFAPKTLHALFLTFIDYRIISVNVAPYLIFVNNIHEKQVEVKVSQQLVGKKIIDLLQESYFRVFFAWVLLQKLKVGYAYKSFFDETGK
jgi:hypothetical protein